MSSNKIISSLNYLSILFAGILFPLIVLFVVPDELPKKHAKAALISHLLLYVPIIGIFIGSFVMYLYSTSSDSIASSFNTTIILILSIVAGLLSLAIFIWNLYKGIKILVTKEEI